MSSQKKTATDKSAAAAEDVTAHMFVADEPGEDDPEKKRKRKASEAPDDDGMGRKRKRK